MIMGPRASRSMFFTKATMRSPGRKVARGQHALGLAEIDDQVVTLLEAANDAADQLSLTVLVLVVDDVALGVAHALEQHLLGGLGRDATERAARLLHVEHAAEFLVLLLRPIGVARVPEHLEAELLADLRFEAVLARDIDGD